MNNLVLKRLRDRPVILTLSSIRSTIGRISQTGRAPIPVWGDFYKEEYIFASHCQSN